MFKIPIDTILLEYAKRQLRQRLKRVTLIDGVFSILYVEVSFIDEDDRYAISVEFYKALNSFPPDATSVISIPLPSKPHHHQDMIRSLIPQITTFTNTDKIQRVSTSRRWARDKELPDEFEYLIESYYPLPMSIIFKCYTCWYENSTVSSGVVRLYHKSRYYREFPVDPPPRSEHQYVSLGPSNFQWG